MGRIFGWICTAAAVAVAGCGGGEDSSGTTQWKFAIEEIQGSVQDAYAREFARLVEADTEGAVDVTVYPYGSLGTSAQLTELVQSGSIQFAMASPGHLGSVIPEVQLFSLHFAFSDDEAANRRLFGDSPALYEVLGEAYAERQLHLLRAFQEGWMVWTANKPLRTPADFAGVKMRTMVSPLLLEAYSAYGANPTPMPYSEVYSGLQLNMIDAQVNPVFAIEEMSFYEVQDYLIFANHLPFVATVVTNPAFYEGLSPEHRRVVQDALEQLETYIFDMQRQMNEERLEKILANSDVEVVRLTEAERNAFREAAAPVRETYLELAGPRGKRLLEIVDAELRPGQ